jgi:endonuclease/exonuclease/phosphatase family metal-dependent hydrolase
LQGQVWPGILDGVALTVASYNIHRAAGLDGRVDVGRIGAVLEEIGADLVGLQEVFTAQAEELARRLGVDLAMGVTRTCLGRPYGNAFLTRLPLAGHHVFDLSRPTREPRGGVRADVLVGGHPLHVFNVHFGLRIRERAEQAAALLSEHVLRGELGGLRVVMGDLNEWFPGPVGRALRQQFLGPRLHRTHPAPLPLFALDRIYWDRKLHGEAFRVHRSRLARVASDHLPVVAHLRRTAAHARAVAAGRP